MAAGRSARCWSTWATARSWGREPAGWRFRRIVADDDAAIGWYDEARWAERLRYAEQSPWDGLHLFRTLRAANVRLLRLLPPDAWDRTGTHSARGPLTPAAMVEIYIEHAEGHAAQTTATRESLAAR